MIANLEYYEQEHKWPPEYLATGYTGEVGNLQYRSEAGFTTSARLFGELNLRLKRAYPDNETLCHEIQKFGAKNYLDLSKSAKNALAYVVGWKRKTRYSRWLTNHKYYYGRKRENAKQKKGEASV